MSDVQLDIEAAPGGWLLRDGPATQLMSFWTSVEAEAKRRANQLEAEGHTVEIRVWEASESTSLYRTGQAR